MNNKSFYIKEYLDFEKCRGIYTITHPWLDSNDSGAYSKDLSLSSRGIGTTMELTEIKAKTKWYHNLVPNFIWNKFMINKVTKLEDVYVTGVDFGYGESGTVENTIKFEYKGEKND